MKETTRHAPRAPSLKYDDWPSETCHRILWLYQRNHSLREIARALGIPRTRVFFVLVDAGWCGPGVAAPSAPTDLSQTRFESALQLLHELCSKYGKPVTTLLDNAPARLAVPALEADGEPPSDPAPSTR